MEEHKKRFDRITRKTAKGWAEAARQRMLSHYTGCPDDLRRVQAALPNINAVHNKINTMFPPKEWPHVVEAEAEAAQAAAVAEANQAKEVGLGIGMPAFTATGELCKAWMKDFQANSLVEIETMGWTFVDSAFKKETADAIVVRVSAWKRGLPSMQSSCNSFEKKVRAAYATAFVHL